MDADTVRGVRNHFISIQASDTGFGPAWGSTPRFKLGTHAQNSLPFRRGGGSGGRARGEGAVEGGARVAGTRTRPRGSPGQHARLWASKSRLLQPASGTASGGPDFRGFSAPHGIHRWIRIRGVRYHFISTQASDTGFGAVWGSTPRFGTHNSLPCIAWCSFRRGRPSPREARWREGRGQRRKKCGWQAPGPGLGAARGSMRASGRASASSCSPRLAQLREGRIFGFSPPNGIHRWMRIRGVRNHFISTRSSDTGFGPAWGLSSRFGTQNSLPCIAWRSWRRGRVGSCF